LLEHELLEPPVHRDAALQHLVLLVDQPAERLLRDRDEGHLVGHLEQREPVALRLLDHRRRDGLVLDADAQAEARDMVVDQPPHERALPVRLREPHAGAQEQLPPGHPGCGIGKLTDVDPPDRSLRRLTAGH
jgi:hypothetical protein